MIRFAGVHKWFGHIHVLNDINLHVRRGEVVVICGPSGSGKSTLIRTINRLEPIDKGGLIVDGIDLSDPKTDINKLRAEIGFVFQQFNIYPHLTVLGNITLAPIKVRKVGKKEAQDQAIKLLERVGLAEKIDSYPSQLSGGQQQRVAIARAIVNDPAIIMADEPTGNLDSKVGKEIMALLLNLNKERGTTLIIITHDPTIGAQAQRIIRIRDGVVEEAPGGNP